MPEIKRMFNGGRMNRDLDDRLVPAGEYREALNINVGKSESADMGAIENLLGNIQVASSGITGGSCIGSYRSNSDDRIYFYVTSNDSYDGSNGGEHGIFSYDQSSKQLRTLVSGSSLNFHKDFKISGINLVDDLLFWTDNRNPPRKINVVRAVNDPTYYTAGVFDNLASVAKFAPYESPTVLAVGTNDEQGQPITSNFLEDKMVRFSYRWKFDDGEYSTLAPFSTTIFSRLGNPDTISTDINDFGEIETFVNAIKSVQLQIPTPAGYGITQVELIYKETGSSALYVVEDKPVAGETSINFFYASQDPFRTLPSDQLTRVYDAVPRIAQSQELVGSRLVYGNFLQNYNIPNINFSVSRTGEDSSRISWGPGKNPLSLKSRRTYQIGIVLADKFGRQSPVILSNSGGDTVFIDPNTGSADSTTAFNALRIVFADAANEIPPWAYSYRVVVKQREQEYYNWISGVSSANTVERLGDSQNKIPRDQTAAIPPSTSATISPCDVSVYPKYVGGQNIFSTTYGALQSIQAIANPTGTASTTTVNNSGTAVTSGICVFETQPVESDLDIFYETSTGGLVESITGVAINIDFFNSYLLDFNPTGSGAHIELNRLRAAYNETFFDVGVRAYVVQENFAEELRFNTLIHSSGLFNSRTGINYINQFNESEGGLTISVDPQDGAIQKLAADDTQLLIFQEDKISRSPIDKDFIYSAEGGQIPVTSNTQFLGTVAPYAGRFGISQDPLSYAEFGFNKYFTDKNNGTVLKLTPQGIQEISSIGMSDFFRDALKASTSIVGSYDEYSSLFMLTIVGQGLDGNEDTNVGTAADGYLTLAFDENSQGWSSFRSFNQESGLSLNNTYYTFFTGNLWKHNDPTVGFRNNFYGLGTQPSYVEPIFNESPSTIKQFNTIGYEGSTGWTLDFIETDVSSIGTLPTPATIISTSLQIIGTAVNGSVTGESTLIGKQNDVITWIITARPISSAYNFILPTDITLSGNTSLSVINPTSLTSEGNIVFRVSYTVGSADSIQTINVGGVGAVLANLPALLTINTDDAVTFSDLTPASQVFNNAGTDQAQFTLLAEDGYYIDPSNVTLDTSGISSFNPVLPAVVTRATAPLPAIANNKDNAVYTYDLTVPALPASGTVDVTGTATAKTNLSWTIPTVNMTNAVFSSPYPGTIYKVSPFDESNITATVTYTGIPSTKTMTPTSATFAITNGSAGGAAVASTTNAAIDAGTNFSAVYSIVLTSPSVDIGAITTVTGGPVDAQVGSIGLQPFNATGSSPVTVSTLSNVSTQLVPSDSWILINGSNATVDLTAEESFTVSVSDNSTGATRNGSISVTNTNPRVTGLTPGSITISQNA